MLSGNWTNIGKENDWNKIELFERRNRAVKSNFKQEILDDEEELKKQIEEPNIAWGDDASLPSDADTLRVSYSLRVLGGLNTPSACNKKVYQDQFTEMVDGYLAELGIDELASRYAYNVVNGRFLWRNRVGALDVAIHVKHSSLSEPIKFNAYDYPLKDTTTSDTKISPFVELVKKGLIDKENVFIAVDAYVKLGNRQRIWPSQEMVMGPSSGQKSRYLFALDGNAAMHCEKIGNALRTIDDWQTGSDAPIAIEAYGNVTQRGIAYRSSRNDFKTLLDKWMNDKSVTEEEKHFVIAMIIRGGVFGEGESE